MGAWGYGPFDNDGAGDLLADIRKGNFTFEGVEWAFEDPDYLEVDGGQIVIALAALARAFLGGLAAPESVPNLEVFGAQLTADRLAWIQSQLDRTLSDGKSSELYELWEDSGDLEKWLESSRASIWPAQ